MSAKPAITYPSHLRLIHPDGGTYGSAVALGNVVLTVAHANVAAGIKIQCGIFVRTVATVRQVIVPGLTTGGDLTGNLSGDLVVLTLDPPFPLEVIRAELAPLKKGTTGKLQATHKDGARSPRVALNKALLAKYARLQSHLPPDYLDPKWLVLELTTKKDRPLIGGDSGGGIYNAKGQLVSLVSRVAAGQGPNLCHPDVRAALAL